MIDKILKKDITLLNAPETYKPMKYPWAFEAWEKQQQMHWLPSEVPLAEDVADWNKKLSKEEKNLLTHVFRFFTQQDVLVGGIYVDKYLKVFQPNDIRMMLMAFANVETIHMAAYAYLLDTIGFPEVEFTAFLKYKEMKDKCDYLKPFNMDSPKDIAKSLAVFSGFLEGLQLFASFAILMNFQRFNKMKGMCQIVAWSIRDETLHVENMIKLFRTFVKENPEIWTDELKGELYQIARDMVSHEDAFIDLAFEQGGIEGMTSDDIKQYIRYIADRRLLQLGLKTNFKVKENPLPWLDAILNGVEFSNFFEQRSTEYSKASTVGEWGDVF
jgi:ribonucleoside-diphosphate reductase beta chain